jgi:hypothetical protein
VIDNTGYLYPGYMGNAVGPGGQDLGPAMSLRDQADLAEKYRQQAAAAAGAGRAAAAASQAASARGQLQEQAQAVAMQTAANVAARPASVPSVPFYKTRGFILSAAAVGGVALLFVALRPSPAPRTYFQKRR